MHHVPFLVIFSILMLTILHGASVLKIAVILTLNYAIARTCGSSKMGPALTWIFNGLVLFANERNEGYEFRTVHPSLETLVCFLYWYIFQMLIY
jgi:protein-cysteine N-palmitoyltransferase HHAT